MNYKKFVYFFLLIFSLSISAQNYIVYDVKPKDTPQSIAETNSISLQELYKYNPDLKNSKSIKKQKIVIPKSDSKNFGFIRYRVKTQETLYSISTNFNLSIADIKAFNPQLYDNELRAGEVLQLPAYKLPKKYQDFDFNQSIKNSNFSAFKHIVLPNENKTDILEKYDMSLKVFDSLNPNIIEIQSGQMVKVMPQQSKSETAEEIDLDMSLQYYEVPKRQTMYSLTKEFKISEDIVFKLNPIVRREGLKAGTIIKLPKQVESIEKSKIINLENYIQNFNEKKLALFLPFSLNKFENDSIKPNKILTEDPLLNISLDIYEGVIWAVEHAKSKGIYTDLKVFDTKLKPSVVDSIINENSFDDRDAIIGPISEANVQALSKSVRSFKTPIFLPISKAEIKASSVINTLPKQETQTETLITYIDSTNINSEHLIFIADSTAQQAYEKFNYTFPNSTFYHVSEPYIELDEIKKLLKPEVINHVVLETNQLGLSESVISKLYKFQKGYEEVIDEEKEEYEKVQFDVKLYTSNRNNAFREVIENKALSELQFTYVSVSKYDVLESNDLIEDYVRSHGFFPNRYVLRAFDLTYDILLRLAYSGSLDNEDALSAYTEYNENRFTYSQSFMSDVYYNDGLYIIQYLPDFEIEILNAKAD